MRVINRLAKIAAESDRVDEHVRRVQEALSVARVKGNGWVPTPVWKKGLQGIAHGAGRCFQEGYDQPTADVG